MPPNGDSWNEHRKYVTEKLDEHSEYLGKIFTRLGNIEVAVAMLKVKAGVWGLLAGLIPVLIMLAVIIIRWKLQQ